MDSQHGGVPEGGAVSITWDKIPVMTQWAGALRGRAVRVLTDTHPRRAGMVLCPFVPLITHRLMLGVGSGFILLPLISLLLLLIEFWRRPKLS